MIGQGLVLVVWLLVGGWSVFGCFLFDAYQVAHPSSMDQVATEDIETEWQEANANRRMQFKMGDYKDSNIRMLTGTIKADWTQLPVERYLAALPFEARSHFRGIQDQGCRPLGHH